MTRKNITGFSAVAVMAVMLIFSCKRETFKPLATENFELSNKAFIRFYNAALSTTKNYLYQGDVPLTGAAVAYGGVFPSSAGFYGTVNSGQQNLLIKDTTTGTTQNQVTVSDNFDAGKRYTIFTYDTATSVKYLAVEDVIEVPADTTARVRFVNLPFSRTDIPNVDIFSVNANQNIFSNVSPLSTTDFIPYASVQSDILYVRPTGTTTNLDTLSNFVASRKRSYTFVFKGNYNVNYGATERKLTSLQTY